MKAKALSPAVTSSMTCKVCAVTFRDVKKFNGHMNSAKHAKKAKAHKKK